MYSINKQHFSTIESKRFDDETMILVGEAVSSWADFGNYLYDIASVSPLSPGREPIPIINLNTHRTQHNVHTRYNLYRTNSNLGPLTYPSYAPSRD